MRFDIKSEPEATIMTITPEIAADMLATSAGNRKLRPWYVHMLATAMRRGEWRVTSQGIGFDVHGRLLDAHHRLNACIEANVSFSSVVVFGLRSDAYEVVDTGMRRTYADRLNERNNVADTLRLGCSFALGTSKPTIDQMRPIIERGLGDAARCLIDFCGTTRRYFSSAPIKLAACVAIMRGGDADYVMGQYRALCLLDFSAMAPISQALVRQVDSGKTNAFDSRETFARGLRVFDASRSNLSKIQLAPDDIQLSVDLARETLRGALASRHGLAGTKKSVATSKFIA